MLKFHRERMDDVERIDNRLVVENLLLHGGIACEIKSEK